MVSVLGFGAGHIGSPDMSEEAAGTLLNRGVDRGINFFDTARGYGLSEQRIGRHLSWRRQDVVISTKVGYGIPGVPDWTYEAVVRGAEEAVTSMNCGVVDLVLLHSCPAEVLTREDILRGLEDIKTRGLARYTGYSGENSDLDMALTLPQIDVVETSVNLCDQGSLADDLNPQGRFTRLGGRGVIAKRPLANGFWRYESPQPGAYWEEYWRRWQVLKSAEGPQLPFPLDRVALGFVLGQLAVSTAIVGTGNIDNLEHNIELALQGPLDSATLHHLRSAWMTFGAEWEGQI